MAKSPPVERIGRCVLCQRMARLYGPGACDSCTLSMPAKFLRRAALLRSSPVLALQVYQRCDEARRRTFLRFFGDPRALQITAAPEETCDDIAEEYPRSGDDDVAAGSN
jgi:hypothetical protein